MIVVHEQFGTKWALTDWFPAGSFITGYARFIMNIRCLEMGYAYKDKNDIELILVK